LWVWPRGLGCVSQLVPFPLSRRRRHLIAVAGQPSLQRRVVVVVVVVRCRWAACPFIGRNDICISVWPLSSSSLVLGDFVLPPGLSVLWSPWRFLSPSSSLSCAVALVVVICRRTSLSIAFLYIDLQTFTSPPSRGVSRNHAPPAWWAWFARVYDHARAVLFVCLCFVSSLPRSPCCCVVVRVRAVGRRVLRACACFLLVARCCLYVCCMCSTLTHSRVA
jgi:hypothetical protein